MVFYTRSYLLKMGLTLHLTIEESIEWFVLKEETVRRTYFMYVRPYSESMTEE